MSCTSFTGPITLVYFQVQNGYVSHILLGSPSECFHEPCFKICQSVRRGTVSCRKGQIHEWSNRQQWTIARIRSFMKVQLHTAQLLPVSWEGEEKTTRRRFPIKIDQPQLIGWILSPQQYNSQSSFTDTLSPKLWRFDAHVWHGATRIVPKMPSRFGELLSWMFCMSTGISKKLPWQKTPCWISPLIADSWQLQAAPKASSTKKHHRFFFRPYVYIYSFIFETSGPGSWFSSQTNRNSKIMALELALKKPWWILWKKSIVEPCRRLSPNGAAWDFWNETPERFEINLRT